MPSPQRLRIHVGTATAMPLSSSVALRPIRKQPAAIGEYSRCDPSAHSPRDAVAWTLLRERPVAISLGLQQRDSLASSFRVSPHRASSRLWLIRQGVGFFAKILGLALFFPRQAGLPGFNLLFLPSLVSRTRARGAPSGDRAPCFCHPGTRAAPRLRLRICPDRPSHT